MVLSKVFTLLGLAMPTYQVFCPNDISPGEEMYFEAEDDQEALSLFTLRGEDADCEIRCAGRLVAFVQRGSYSTRATG